MCFIALGLKIGFIGNGIFRAKGLFMCINLI